jgi:hypothetical protein
VTSDDLVRDGVLTQRIALFRPWIQPRHLELPTADDGADDSAGGFLLFAQQGARRAHLVGGT